MKTSFLYRILRPKFFLALAISAWFFKSSPLLAAESLITTLLELDERNRTECNIEVHLNTHFGGGLLDLIWNALGMEERGDWVVGSKGNSDRAFAFNVKDISLISLSADSVYFMTMKAQPALTGTLNFDINTGYLVRMVVEVEGPNDPDPESTDQELQKENIYCDPAIDI